MKLKLLSFLLLYSTFFFAQNVSFTNPNFKAKVVASSPSNTTAKNLIGNYFAVDANADGEIQETEAQQVSELNISSSVIASLVGINSFTSLTKLVCTGNPLSGAADLTGLTLINYLDISVSGLNLGTKANLETLLLNTGITSITYDSPTATLKTFRGGTAVFLSINYLKRLSLQDVTIYKFGPDFPYTALKYHTQLNRLYLGTNFTSNGDATRVTFAGYNQLDDPVYPQNIKTLVIGNLFDGLPIQNFHNLESLTFASSDPNNASAGCTNCQLFNATNFPFLKELNFIGNYNPIQNLDLSSLSHLAKFTTHDISFDANAGQHYTINFGNNASLAEVSFQELPTAALDFSQNINLKKISILSHGNQFTNFLNINVNLAPANNLEEIDLNGYIFNYTNSEWSYQGITLNNIDQSSKLKKVKLQSCKIANPFPINSQFFTNFIAYDSFFNTLDFGHLPNFNHFELNNYTVTILPPFTVNDLSIDLSGSPALPQVDILYPKLRYLSMKNGVEDNDVDISNDGLGLTVCIDATDYDNPIFPNGISNWDLPANTVITNYCEGLAPEGSYNSLIGKVRFDGNANGCDNADVIVPNMKIKSTVGVQNSYTLSNASGDYLQYLGLGNYTTIPVFENPTYFTVTPGSFPSSFTTYDNIQTQDICIAPNGTHNDLEVSIIPVNLARPGFNTKYKIIYKNKGTTVLSGNLSFQYDDSVMDLVNSSVTPDSQATGTLNWNFTNLGRFETKQIVVEMNLNTPTETPPLDDGSILHFTATINPVPGDETPNDNVFGINQIVRNSHDPNDKTCLEGSSVGTSKIGDYVNYMIRFENTGSASAVNVVVRDMINTAKFDVTSILPVDASHPFRMTITEDNKVEFFFENIMLPGTPSELRYGYITFKIKLKSTLVNGNTFSNSANIYFDYNAPVVTNTATTTIQNLGLNESENPKLVAYPNPVKNILSFETANAIIKIELYDLTGRIINVYSVTNNTINLNGLKTGNYIIKAYSENEVLITKIIKE